MVKNTAQNNKNELTGKAKTKSQTAAPDTYDAIVIGAGICGTIFLAHAREKGLSCIVLEKQTDVGGLWNKLPSWQDIQNRRQDIALDGVPLDGVDQPAMQRYVREWVRRFGLEKYLRLGCEVTGVSWKDDVWTVRTKQGGTFRAKNLIVATGAQNEIRIPDVERNGSEIKETHSFELQHPESLSGQRVVVVGGGASAQDMLELALNNGAKDVHWVYRRRIKWFLPTRRSKQRAWPNLRELALGQSINGTATANAIMRLTLNIRYKHFGITELAPDERFDFDKHQMIPGRYPVLRNLDAITRHRAEVRSMHVHELTLSNGERIATDRVLWATGYDLNLRFLGLPEYKEVRRLPDLLPKLGSLVRSLDYPNLFFLGMALISSTSSTPLFAAVESKTIISHIRGKCEIPEKIFPHHITHWGIIRYYATFDRDNYPRWWKIKYGWLAFWYAALQNRSLRFGIKRSL